MPSLCDTNPCDKTHGLEVLWLSMGIYVIYLHVEWFLENIGRYDVLEMPPVLGFE